MPDETRLAIVIPTYRWNALARATLTQAAAIGSAGIRVHIGDNSANPEKHAFLEELANRSTNVAVTCHPRNLGADPNWLFLVGAQSAPYICMAADDDAFSGAYFTSAVALLEDDPSCATASGLHVSVSHPARRQPAIYVPSERREAGPLDRIRRYSGENSICYAISRRASVQWFARFVETNPLPCPFYDYMLAFHLLSIGTYRLDQRGYAYIYDHSNWQLNDSFIGSNKRWYAGYGLPEGFGYLTRLHWAVVAAHFFSSTFRAPELADDAADELVAYLFERQRREFARDFYRYRGAAKALFAGHDEAAAACMRLITQPYAALDAIFDDFAQVVAVFSPDIAARYRAFQRESLQPAAGAIRLSRRDALRSLPMARARAANALRRPFG